MMQLQVYSDFPFAQSIIARQRLFVITFLIMRISWLGYKDSGLLQLHEN